MRTCPVNSRVPLAKFLLVMCLGAAFTICQQILSSKRLWALSSAKVNIRSIITDTNSSSSFGSTSVFFSLATSLGRFLQTLFSSHQRNSCDSTQMLISALKHLRVAVTGIICLLCLILLGIEVRL